MSTPPNYRVSKCCASCDHCSAHIRNVFSSSYRSYCIIHKQHVFSKKVCDDWKEGPLNLWFGWK